MIDHKASNGEVLLITQGDGADYHAVGNFKVLKDMEPDAVKHIAYEIQSQFGSGNTHNYDVHDRFVERLVELGYIEEITYNELYIGDYGNLFPWGDTQ